ncbi:MAG: hypothetical protein ABFR47_06805 [Verrucomicrobiota bacterium]
MAFAITFDTLVPPPSWRLRSPLEAGGTAIVPQASSLLHARGEMID